MRSDKRPEPKATTVKKRSGNPKKRRNILDGAQRAFAAVGFDAASMDDVAAAAGVSKSTLYVYFGSKEQLFAALVAEERDQYLDEISTVLIDPLRPAATLQIFGERLANQLASRKVIQSHRTVFGVVDRMPELGSEFYLKGPARSIEILADYLKRAKKVGSLEIDDPHRAAMQFIDLATGALVKPRLFNFNTQEPNGDETAKHVRQSVILFMKGYGPVE